MKKIFIVAFTSALLLMGTCRALGQEHGGFQNECDSLQNATPPDLVQYLNGVIPDEKNGDCVTWAIKRLGKEQYEPAIAVLAKLLDFRRPPTPREKQGIYLRVPFVSEIYPAAGALNLIGKKALPEVLHVIEAESSSAVARENAVAVWMEIHRYSDEHPKGVTLLRQEEIKAKDDATRQRLSWAVQKALRYCGSPEEAACKAAAKTGEF